MFICWHWVSIYQHSAQRVFKKFNRTPLPSGNKTQENYHIQNHSVHTRFCKYLEIKIFNDRFFYGEKISVSNSTLFYNFISGENWKCYITCLILPDQLKLYFIYLRIIQKLFVKPHLENTHKANISTLKTTKCGKLMMLKSQSKCSQALQQKITSTIP